MLREFEIIIIIIFCVFRVNGIEENRDKEEGDEEKAGFEGDEKGVSFYETILRKLKSSSICIQS